MTFSADKNAPSAATADTRSSKGPNLSRTLPTWLIVILISAVATAMGGLSYLSDRDHAEARPHERTVAEPNPTLADAAEQSVSLAQVQEMIRQRSAVLVDARSPDQFRRGHLPGALNVPAAEVDADLPEQLRRRARLMPVVVYCASEDCPDAERLARRLRLEGMHPVRVFEGGWRQWQQRKRIFSAGP